MATEPVRDIRTQQISNVLKPQLAVLGRKIAMAVLHGEIHAGDFSSALDGVVNKYVDVAAPEIAQHLVSTFKQIKV